MLPIGGRIRIGGIMVDLKCPNFLELFEVEFNHSLMKASATQSRAMEQG
ncbi:MAG: hypothetical protein M1556_01150 [Candidatus Thermoplasmatota archaeon]|jgi:hypothetical protein|nr:hypothetical protein [Candidatus Thermoplasmatota archaeon]